MVRAIGVDVADVARLAAALERVPRLRERLFTPGERDLPVRSLAARFAAKEAGAKALRSPGGMSWQDCEVVGEPSGAPPAVVGGMVGGERDGAGVSVGREAP